MDVIRIKNWRTFQHYKNRRPTWIKLHKELLDDFDFVTMSDASRALAPFLWLLASEYESGEIPYDLSMIAFRCHIPEPKTEKCLNELKAKGFIDCASSVLAGCKQVAMPETERYKEEVYKQERESDIQTREKRSSVGHQIFFKGNRLRITREEHQSLAVAFEGIDLPGEYLKMDAWLVTNHRNYRSFGRFANSWLSRNKIPGTGGNRNGARVTAQDHIDRALRNAEILGLSGARKPS